MPITITIKDKFVTDRLTQHIEDELCTYYPDAILKKIKVPSAAKLAKSILADEKFVAEFTKKLTKTAMASMDDMVYDTLTWTLIPQLAEFVSACEQVEHDEYESDRESEEERTINHMVQTLQKCGYVVTKAKAK